MLDPRLRDSDGNTVLHIAVLRNLLPVVVWLCETCQAPLLSTNRKYQTPHELAMKLGYMDIYQYLINNIFTSSLLTRRIKSKTI